MKRLKRLLSRRRSPQVGAATDLSLAVPSTPRQNAAAEARANPEENIHLSKFEQLPLDIRHHVLLSVDTIQDLGALVHASPSYYRQYLPRKSFWIWRCLWLEAGPALIDAYTANLCASPPFQKDRNSKRVQDFLAAYRSRRSKPSETLFNLPTAEEIHQIAVFHSSTIKPILHQYVTWAQGNLDVLSSPETLSRTEQHRLLRGLYRFQICCHVFGISQFGFTPGWMKYKYLGQFLRSYEPWEIEEILCINSFSDFTVDVALDAVKWDFHPDNPKFDSKRVDLSEPEGTYDLYLDRVRYRDGIMSIGLSLLGTILQMRDHDELVEVISDNIESFSDCWMAEATSLSEQDRYREIYYSERDRAQDRRDKLLFSGDRDDSPPLAWVTIWQGTYSNLYGPHIRRSFRDWGYVIWDSRRMEESGALAIMDEQWKVYNEIENGDMVDPRDIM